VQVGNLVKVYRRNGLTINIITKIEKRRNDYGTHDKWINIGTCGSEFFHEKDVEIINATEII